MSKKRRLIYFVILMVLWGIVTSINYWGNLPINDKAILALVGTAFLLGAIALWSRKDNKN